MNANNDEFNITLKHEKAYVLINRLPSGKYKISVHKLDPDYFVRFDNYETSYPIELIKQLFDAKGPGWLCDEIARDESLDYTGAALKWRLLSYVDEDAFKNASILDFGCGSGASSCSMSRMFPSSNITGIELEEKLLAIAEARIKFYGIKNIKLLHSPDSINLPDNLDKFDYIIMTGVFEHLLPNERIILLPQLWSLLKPGGILFLHETPNKYFPLETHTTGGLFFINYLPTSLAHLYARKLSKRNLTNDNWEMLLRKGIRGGSIKEIFEVLINSENHPILMKPSRLGVKNRIDLWYMSLEKSQRKAAKEFVHKTIEFIYFFTGIEFVPYLDLAIRKKE